MTNVKIEGLYDSLAKAEKANDHEQAKYIMKMIQEEMNKESLRKWVWYR
ncbi:hypothetical protein CYYG_00013 [Cyanophage SS120-1]|uniref:Uncharacterized protein n=1 Tax=Cyanophage SS120-1 TaxID=616674 RepID=M1T347_9CAUD|nr:hypothetical protein CYYG_00013 [Cyanophage SS120-1]AGG54515.1 hypothetical protein CYYG_00013 [Cyanophage SS120-1]